jgi:hypothetical protein
MLWTQRGGAGGGPMSWARILTAFTGVTWIAVSAIFG